MDIFDTDTLRTRVCSVNLKTSYYIFVIVKTSIITFFNVTIWLISKDEFTVENFVNVSVVILTRCFTSISEAVFLFFFRAKDYYLTGLYKLTQSLTDIKQNYSHKPTYN